MPSSRPQRNRRYRKWRDAEMVGQVCRDCRERGIWTAAEELHHVQPLSRGGALMDPANTVPLCRSCHTRRHEGRRR